MAKRYGAMCSSEIDCGDYPTLSQTIVASAGSHSATLRTEGDALHRRFRQLLGIRDGLSRRGSSHIAALLCVIILAWYSSPPFAAASEFSISAISAGDDYTCALRTDGKVMCWGNNLEHQLGSAVAGSKSANPVVVPDLADAVSVSAGNKHACALTRTGGVTCWGANSSGQLGSPPGNRATGPVVVRPLPEASAVVAGGAHTCVILRDKTVRCWGNGVWGQLGNGARNDSYQPVAPIGLAGIARIWAGGDRTCSITDKGVLKCWGGAPDALIPKDVRGGGGASALAIGRTGYICMAMKPGGVRCWGGGSQSPNFPGSGREVPVRMPGLTGATALGIGNPHACVLTAGRVSCFGRNPFGVLGDGGQKDRKAPVAVEALSSVRLLAVGEMHACSVVGPSEVSCWGRNSYGECGIDPSQGQSFSRPVKMTTVLGGDHPSQSKAEPTPANCPSGYEATNSGCARKSAGNEAGSAWAENADQATKCDAGWTSAKDGVCFKFDIVETNPSEPDLGVDNFLEVKFPRSYKSVKFKLSVFSGNAKISSCSGVLSKVVAGKAIRQKLKCTKEVNFAASPIEFVVESAK